MVASGTPSILACPMPDRGPRRYNPHVTIAGPTTDPGSPAPTGPRGGLILAACFGILTVAHIAATRLSWLDIPLQTDAGIWAYSGSRLLDGAVLYRDLWDNKPPAMHYTYAAFQWLFGRGTEGPFFWLDAVITILVCGLTYRLARRFASRAAAAGGTLLLSIVFCHRVLADWGLNAEKFVALFEVLACVLAVSVWGRSGHRGRWFVAGVCCGVAGLYKQGGVLCLAALVASLAWTRIRRCERDADAMTHVPWLMAGWAVPWAIAVGAMAQAGSLGAFWHQVVAYDATRIGTTQSERAGLFDPEHWRRVWDGLSLAAVLLGPAVIGIASWARGKLWPRACAVTAPSPQADSALLPVMAYAALTLAAFFWIPYGFGHYLLQAAPPAAVVAAWWFDRAAGRNGSNARAAVTGFAIMLGLVALRDHVRFTLDPSCEARRAFVAQRNRVAVLVSVLESHAAADESVLLWQPDYPVLYRARRRFALEWTNSIVIFMGRSHRLDPDMPQLLERLAADPPDVIVDWTPVGVQMPTPGAPDAEPQLLTPAAGFSLAELPNPNHPRPEGRLLAPLKRWIREHYGGQMRVAGRCTVYFRDRPWRPWQDVLLGAVSPGG